MMRSGVGVGTLIEPAKAANRALIEAIRTSGEPALTIVFSAYESPEHLFESLSDATENSKMVGARFPGLIYGPNSYEKGVEVITLGGDNIEAVTHLQHDIAGNPFDTGKEIGKSLIEKGGRKPGTVLLFPEARAADVSSLLMGLYSIMGPAYDYLGAGSGDQIMSRATYQFTGEGIISGGVAAALIRGIKFRMHLGHGLKPIGEPMMITSLEGRSLLEIDGMPAAERYTAVIRRYLKHAHADIPQYPIGLPTAGGGFLIRVPISIEKDGSILMASEVPANSIAVIMHGDAEDMIFAAEEVVSKAATDVNRPGLFMIFDCFNRYNSLGEEFSRELSTVNKFLEQGIPIAGTLSLGEISSFYGSPIFYNKTFLVAVGC